VTVGLGLSVARARQRCKIQHERVRAGRSALRRGDVV